MVLGVALVLVTSQQVSGDESKEIDALALGLCLITGLSLAFRRSHPLGQFVVAISATIAYAALDYPGGPIFVVAFASALAMVAERRSLMPAAFIGGAALLAVQFTVYGWALHLFGFAAVWFVGTALFGEAMRLRREQQRTTEARAEFAERSREEEARRRVAEERLRIARDVHDVRRPQPGHDRAPGRRGRAPARRPRAARHASRWRRSGGSARRRSPK